MIGDTQLVDIFKALSDAHRLELFHLLVYSDQTNSELMNATGLSQNLLSHHLSVMADCKLIEVHQSIGDARRRYYSPNLQTAREVSHWWQQYSPSLSRPMPRLERPRRVLFLCSTNSMRSLMAEAMANHLSNGALLVRSAGLLPGRGIPSLTYRVLEEHAIPSDHLEMKTYRTLGDTNFEFVITVCDRVHESEMPPELTRAEIIHWSLRDPLQETSDPQEQLALSRELYQTILLRLTFFVQRLAESERAP